MSAQPDIAARVAKKVDMTRQLIRQHYTNNEILRELKKQFGSGMAVVKISSLRKEHREKMARKYNLNHMLHDNRNVKAMFDSQMPRPQHKPPYEQAPDQEAPAPAPYAVSPPPPPPPAPPHGDHHEPDEDDSENNFDCDDMGIRINERKSWVEVVQPTALEAAAEKLLSLMREGNITKLTMHKSGKVQLVRVSCDEFNL